MQVVGVHRTPLSIPEGTAHLASLYGSGVSRKRRWKMKKVLGF